MQNPFKYGSIVGKESFCNRRRELSDISRAMENGEKLFIYSERRLGKTSLVKLALERLPKTRYVAAYVDLWSTDGEASFAAAIAKGISESMATTTDKLLDVAGTFFGRLAPSITLDDQGKPQVTFGLSRAADSEIELEEVLAAPGRIAQQGKKKVVVVLDEFQQIAEYDNDRVERSLRSAVQTQGAVEKMDRCLSPTASSESGSNLVRIADAPEQNSPFPRYPGFARRTTGTHPRRGMQMASIRALPRDVLGRPLQPLIQAFPKTRVDLRQVGCPQGQRHVPGRHKGVHVRQLFLRHRTYLSISVH